MKKFKMMTFILVLITLLFGGSLSAYAATTLPDSVTSEPLREVEFIENFPVIVKKTNHGYVYCLNMSHTYAANVTFSKTGEVAAGYNYILNNKPNTGNVDKDFYITQMAVWYYEDYLNNDNFNLVPEVKKYIIRHKDTEEVSGYIYKLYDGAKNYKEPKGKIDISPRDITFTKDGEYFVSNDIEVHTENLNGNLSYSLTGSPAGSKIVKVGDKIRVKVPVNKIGNNKQITISLNVSSTYKAERGYYYFHSDAYQKVLYNELQDVNKPVNDSIKMVVRNKVDFDVTISKSDITQSKEIPGATLVVKDKNGNTLYTWVSTNESKKITLSEGEYSLSETIAPVGYKLSTTTINFKVDANGSVYVKNEKDNYVAVDKVVMINVLKDVVTIAKKDSKTDALVAGATLVITDKNGNIVKEFTTTDAYYQLTLDAGVYTIEEKSAPNGYIKSNEVITFELFENGTLKVKNNNGDYIESNLVTFYNTKGEEVPVPATAKSSTLLIIGGIMLIIGGTYCVKKTIKEC